MPSSWDPFVLPIFPEGGLSSSITTTIWVGVWILCYFNLRFGWVLSGLVIPGYLAPLLLVKPWAAAVVLLEGFLAYFLGWLFSGPLVHSRTWSSFFGRDRFMALVLWSIAVRLLFDGYLLPEFGAWANNKWQLTFNYQDNLHSYGLIIVSLVANQFWKTGFFRGLIPLATSLVLTVLVVRFVLMEFTNFGFGELEYLYDDLASSILASPKAYIILIASALLASRMNLIYGWDFNGILIPSLIALQWYQPVRILVTLAESLVILFTAQLLLRLPWFARMTIEGARKLLLFFNISFIYKLLLGYAMLWLAPDQKAADYYGFGYLLATLMAIKIHDKGILARLTRATLQTSAIAVVFASLVGFGLTLLTRSETEVPAMNVRHGTLVLDRPDITLDRRLSEEHINLYRIRATDSVTTPLPSEYAAWRRALDDLERHLRTGQDEALDQAAAELAAVGYRIERLAGGILYLSQDNALPPRGWGVFAFDPKASGSLLIEVPGSLDEPNVIASGLGLFKVFGARGLLISGSRRYRSIGQTGNVLLNREMPFHIAHLHFNGNDVLQVRALTIETIRQLRSGGGNSDSDTPPKKSGLWITNTLPAGLHLNTLKELLGTLDIHWSAPPIENRQRADLHGGFAELFLTLDAQRQLLSGLRFRDRPVVLLEKRESLVGYLQEWLLNTKGFIAEHDSNLYQRARVEELLFFDEEVLTPLLHLIREAYQDGRWTEAGRKGLRAVAGAAQSLGYRLIQYRHVVSGREYLILAESEDPAERQYWGTYVLRLGASDGYLLEVPRPLHEVNSFEFAVDLFDRLQASALLIGGAHPQANADGSADLIRLDNKVTLFNLFNQVLLREAGDATQLVVQIRSLGFRTDRPPVESDVLVSLASGGSDPAHLDGQTRRLLQRLEQDGLSWRFADGSDATMGYEVGGIAQAQYLEATRHKDLALLWLSPLARTFYRQQDENRWQEAQFRAVDIETLQTDLYGLVEAQTWTAAPPDALRERVAAYQREPDVVRLRAVTEIASRFRLRRVVDTSSKQSFLLVFDRRGGLALVANLVPRRFDAVVYKPSRSWESFRYFIDSRCAWLQRAP